ncbi:MAG: NUDIX domain-containing protein [Rhizobiaceae bacterium]|nr:NUDIX domain-containing protein [Rhizobiaceae bacterium]
MNKNVPLNAASAACLDGKHMLLVLRGRPPAKGSYAFPGGRLEPGETPEDAMRRELREETGLEALTWRPFREVQLPATEPGAADFALTVFLVTEVAGTLAAGDDAAEARWVTLDQAEVLPVTTSVITVMRELLGSGD